MMKSIITCFMAAFLSLSFNQVILAQETPSAQESVEYRLPTYQLPPKDGTIQPSNWNITPAGITGIQAPQQKAAVLSAFPGQVMKVRVLCVIYTNTAGGTTTAGEISQLKAEVEEARMFYWRNSHGRCYLEVTYMIIDEYKELDEFWNLWGGYWMTFWDTDGDGRSVEQDLRNRGVTNNMYSGVVNFYAWGENGHPAALGGGAYGVDVGFLGQTAYCAIPHCWDPTTNDWFFIHEFHHELDSMFHYSGFPEYPHADLPIELPGDFGEGYDFNAFIMRTWPINKWMSLASPWGSIMSVTDADLDGLADEGTHLPLTEVTLNSSPAMVDTDGDGLTDLAEAMGGILRSAIAFDTDTDNDGLIDGLDKYPIYAIDEFTPRGTRTIDGNLEPAWHHLGSPLTINNAKLSASIKTNWDSNYLYLAFQTGRYCKPRIYLDAGNDGWFHGKDNYEIIINPNRSVGSQVEVAHIWDCSPESVEMYDGAIWDNDGRYTAGRLIRESDIICRCTSIGNAFYIELAIPKNTVTSLVPEHGDRIGFRVIYDNVDGTGSKSALAFETDVFVDLVLLNSTTIYREEQIADAKNRNDGQTVDLIGKVVSGVFSGVFYIQDEDRTSGIKVSSNSIVNEGDRVRVVGTLATEQGERVLKNAVVDKLPFSP